MSEGSDKAVPFTIQIGDQVLDDLRERLKRTRFPEDFNNSDWEYGFDTEYLRSLIGYWAGQYDWRKRGAGNEQAPALQDNHRRGTDSLCSHEGTRSASQAPAAASRLAVDILGSEEGHGAAGRPGGARWEPRGCFRRGPHLASRARFLLAPEETQHQLLAHGGSGSEVDERGSSGTTSSSPRVAIGARSSWRSSGTSTRIGCWASTRICRSS